MAPGPPSAGSGLLALWMRGLTLVRPWQILSFLDLSGGDVREREGRSATQLRGVPRGGDFRGFRQLHGLAHGDSYDLVVDDATGVLVELVARWGERDVERCTLHDLRVGEPVDPALFDLNAVGAVEDTQPATRTFRPLAALVDDVDFAVLGPSDEAYLGLVERHDDGIVVVAHPYGGRSPERRLWFSQSLGEKMADPADWEGIELPDGTPARWWSPDNDPEDGQPTVRTGRHPGLGPRPADDMRYTTWPPSSSRSHHRQRPTQTRLRRLRPEQDELRAGAPLPRPVEEQLAMGKEAVAHACSPDSRAATLRRRPQRVGRRTVGGECETGRVIVEFAAELWVWDARKGNTWVFISLPTQASDEIRDRAGAPRPGFGSVRVQVSIGSSTWATSVFPDATLCCYVLPVKRAVRTAEDLDVGDVATVTVTVVGE